MPIYERHWKRYNLTIYSKVAQTEACGECTYPHGSALI